MAIFRQSVANSPSTPSTSVSVPFGLGGVIQGDLLVAVSNSATSPSISDSQGNVWTAIGSPVGALSSQMFWATAKVSGANTVTLTTSVSNSLALGLLEYTPVKFDVSSQISSGSGTTTPVSGSITPSFPEELGIFFVGLAGANNESITSVPANWNIRINYPGGSSSQIGVIDNLSLLSGPQTTTLTFNNTGGDNGLVFSAFKTIVSAQVAVGVLIDEIGGAFESLPISTNDPPQLNPSSTVLSNRFYLSQGAIPPVGRHCQIQLSGGATNTKDEVLALTIRGEIVGEQA